MAVLALGLAAGVLLWRRAVVPLVLPAMSPVVLPVESQDVSPRLAPATRVVEPPSGEQRPLWAPLAQARFRHLLVVYVLNGMASAVPATLVLFFVQDRLQAPRSLEPLFLGSYFLCAAAAIPLWLRGVVRWGLARTWALGMGLSVAVFAWVLALGAGDWPAFVAVCVLSGVALGADLVLPAAMLNGLIADGGHRGHSEGAHLGWWSFATKLNLALAAGVALPLLGVLGYAPGQQSASALWALSVVYGAVPCVLKLGAWALLHWFFIRQETP
jgi:Na+/melibiose symporter-like transporter